MHFVSIGHAHDALQPHASSSFARPSALSALLAAVLAYYGISDLAATYVHEQLATLYWSTQAPLRATFFLVLCAWSYYSRPGGMFVDRTEALRLAARKGAGENLGSGIILTWAFLEMMGWFSVRASPCSVRLIVACASGCIMLEAIPNRGTDLDSLER